ncbi:MAG: pyridoxamine 5'-phosphate oxidase family protein [Clostridia bacterium]|nr:pyridoxamine 5'-phosphate oxidase family protein [Clostridia bacterium]
MRRFRQALSEEECVSLLKTEKRGTLAVIGDGGYPYALPINFYYDEAENRIYFHCSREGHKADAMSNSRSASPRTTRASSAATGQSHGFTRVSRLPSVGSILCLASTGIPCSATAFRGRLRARRHQQRETVRKNILKYGWFLCNILCRRALYYVKEIEKENRISGGYHETHHHRHFCYSSCPFLCGMPQTRFPRPGGRAHRRSDRGSNRGAHRSSRAPNGCFGLPYQGRARYAGLHRH